MYVRGVVCEECGVCASVRCIDTSVIEPNNDISDKFENVSTITYLCQLRSNGE